jgi:hypothetical protein
VLVLLVSTSIHFVFSWWFSVVSQASSISVRPFSKAPSQQLHPRPTPAPSSCQVHIGMALPALHSEGTSKNSKQSKEASRQAASLWLMETAHMSLFGS